jgi:enterochelin esterase-like enzyme
VASEGRDTRDPRQPPRRQQGPAPDRRHAQWPRLAERPVRGSGAQPRAIEAFELDLLNDIIPFIEADDPVKTGREDHAIADPSMGGGQSLNFGLGHLDRFVWVGGFLSAPISTSPRESCPTEATPRSRSSSSGSPAAIKTD